MRLDKANGGRGRGEGVGGLGEGGGGRGRVIEGGWGGGVTQILKCLIVLAIQKYLLRFQIACPAPVPAGSRR